MPCIVADDLTPEQIKAFRVADNKTAELAEWDFEKLEIELAELADLDFDMEKFGFDSFIDDLQDLAENYQENKQSLQEKYIVPPFSILDTRQGYWQDRKKLWKSFIKSGNGRDDELLGGGLKQLGEKYLGGGESLTGTSIFDPVLCEILLKWFCPANGKVIDPFAGGSVRGIVSALLGNEYTGIDLSKNQIEANIKNLQELQIETDFTGNMINFPNWINDDSTNIDKIIFEKQDFLLTCPPYADLEVYSDNPRDISNMKYDDFKAAYFEIIKKACETLKDNAYAAIVVGDVRDKKGYYYNFVGDTIEAFRQAGLKYYNECILLNQVSTAALRADGQFKKYRKVVKIHQNVLIFLKGNEREIVLPEYDYEITDIDYDEMEV